MAHSLWIVCEVRYSGRESSVSCPSEPPHTNISCQPAKTSRHISSDTMSRKLAVRAIYFAVMWVLNQSRKPTGSSFARVSILTPGHNPAAYCNMCVYSTASSWTLFGLHRDFTKASITISTGTAPGICLQ